MWGVGAGGAVTLFLSGVPLFQADVLKKLPLISTYFEGRWRVMWSSTEGPMTTTAGKRCSNPGAHVRLRPRSDDRHNT